MATIHDTPARKPATPAEPYAQLRRTLEAGGIPSAAELYAAIVEDEVLQHVAHAMADLTRYRLGLYHPTGFPSDWLMLDLAEQYPGHLPRPALDREIRQRQQEFGAGGRPWERRSYERAQRRIADEVFIATLAQLSSRN